MLNRRKFVTDLFTGTVGAALLGVDTSGMLDFAVKPLRVFDFHCHPGLFPTKGTPGYAGDESFIKTVNEMSTGSLAGAFFSLVADAKILKIEATGVRAVRSFEPGEAWQDYQRQMGDLKKLLDLTDAKIATKLSHFDKYNKKGHVAAFISCEGGDFLEGKIDRLNQMYEDGVRSLQPAHYAPSELGDIQTAAPVHNGVSKFGREVIQAMNKLGMLIDVAHATYQTTKAIADISTAPIILSHSILEIAGKPVPRAISADHAKLVAQTGGVIGMWPSGFNENFDAFIENTLRMIEAVGIDHVGLGTDMDGNYKPVLNSYLQLSQWVIALRSKGLSEQELYKLTEGNARRVLKVVL